MTATTLPGNYTDDFKVFQFTIHCHVISDIASYPTLQKFCFPVGVGISQVKMLGQSLLDCYDSLNTFRRSQVNLEGRYTFELQK